MLEMNKSKTANNSIYNDAKRGLAAYKMYKKQYERDSLAQKMTNCKSISEQRLASEDLKST